MQFPESWLREFCNPPLTTQQIADTLTMGGLEVEDIAPVAPPFTGVVVGEIKEAVQHPNADRLRVCRVDVGLPDWLDIVCGAPNARVGIKVPCATVGAQLPSGEDGKPFLIGKGKLRGVESQGMLCSARELKLSEDHGGLLELAADAPVGADIRGYLSLDDRLLTLKLTPNLGHALSVYGVARELSALTGTSLHVPVFPVVPVNAADTLPIKISAPDLCGRFSGRVVRGINTQAKTPQWMVDRLTRCGQRSVTALVDISNYVMFEFGRPSHIFDLDKIHGGLDVRWAKVGESLKLLNGNTVALDDKVGIIADDVAVESLAGIMGGDATAVSDDTQNVYIEAAFWWPQSVAGRSRRFNFSTDAGHRFERGVDPSQTVEHLERITQLVLDICGTAETRCGPVDDQSVDLSPAKPVTLRVARAAKIIGMDLLQAQCVAALRRLGLPLDEGPGTVTVTPPPYRFDLVIEEDLIEEITRMVGYDSLPTDAPLGPIAPKLRTESQRSGFAVRRALAALGYQETINFSFVEARWERELAGNADPIRLLNPIASQMGVMRSSLLGSLLQSLNFNLDRKADRVRLFELGRVFLRDPSVGTTDSTVKGIHQPLRVAGLIYGRADALQWGRKDGPADFFDAKGDVEALFAPTRVQFEACEHPAMHPGRCARIVLNGRDVGLVGELHPQWRQAYDLPQAPLMFELELDALVQRDVAAFKTVSKFQAVQRDVAFVVSEKVSFGALLACVQDTDIAKGLLSDVLLFDVFRPNPAAVVVPGGLTEGEKSLALRLTLNSDAATLTDEQIEPVVKAIVERAASVLGARLR